MTEASEQPEAKGGRRPRSGLFEDWRDALAILLMLIVAAVSGAVIAKFWPEGDTPSPALTERLGALETRVAAASASETEIAGLKTRVAQLEERVKVAEGALAARVGPTDGTLAGGTPPTTAASADSMQQLAAIAKTVDEIKTRLATLEGDKTLVTRLDEMNTKLQTQGEQVAAVDGLKSSFDKLDTRLTDIEHSDLMVMARRAALTAAIANLMRATQGSGSFTTEYEAVAQLAGNEPAIADVGKYAPSGLPTVGVLTASFPDAARSAVAAEEAASGASWWSQLWANLSALVTVRSTGEVKGDTTQARVTRAELRLKAGDLRAAIEELQPITGAARGALESWYAPAEARVKLEKALAELNAHAIAALAEPPQASEPVPQLPTR